MKTNTPRRLSLDKEDRDWSDASASHGFPLPPAAERGWRVERIPCGFLQEQGPAHTFMSDFQPLEA